MEEEAAKLWRLPLNSLRKSSDVVLAPEGRIDAPRILEDQPLLLLSAPAFNAVCDLMRFGDSGPQHQGTHDGRPGVGVRMVELAGPVNFDLGAQAQAGERRSSYFAVYTLSTSQRRAVGGLSPSYRVGHDP